jgi:hypothetical protein
MNVCWRERLGGMTYAWSVECPLNDQGLVRPLVTATGGPVFMCGGEVCVRTSARSPLAIATAPDWRVSPAFTSSP